MQWTPEQRDEALRLLADVGKAEASRRTGIPAGTIASWGNRAGVTAPSPEIIRAANAHRLVTLAERKQQLAGRLGEAAAIAADKLIERIERDEITAKDLVVALTAAIDRLQLLTGGATERTETITAERSPQAEAEVARVLRLARSA